MESKCNCDKNRLCNGNNGTDLNDNICLNKQDMEMRNVNSVLINNITVAPNNKSIYVNDVHITEDDLKELLFLKKKKQMSQDSCNNIHNGAISKKPMDGHENAINTVQMIDKSVDKMSLKGDSASSGVPIEEHKIISSMKCTNYLIENRINKSLDMPHSNSMNALFMDYYHLVMAYTFFRQKKHENISVFELFFRKCPFKGEFAVLGGVHEVIKYINCFRFTQRQLEYIRKKMSHYEYIDEFVDYLKGVNGSRLSIHCMEEGSIVFANEPLITLEGPLLICQILESAILNLINYPTLIATNSMMHKISINQKTLAEFGCRRAQGPDGALSGSRYAYAGADFTSNVYASFLYDIPILGTMSHSFILSFKGDQSVPNKYLDNHDFLSIVNKNKEIVHKLYDCKNANESELLAFVAFAQINPKMFISLIDTYSTLESGIFNFLIVALSLHEINYKPIGIRIDSGDLKQLSNECKKIFIDISSKLNVPFNELKICISNDINEKVIQTFNQDKHHIDMFAIGTNLITCQSQPSLGLVFKLVQINNQPCFKITNEHIKSNYPYKKMLYRLYTEDDYVSVDYIQQCNAPQPLQNKEITCIDMLNQCKKIVITPKQIENKLLHVWDNGKLLITFKTIHEIKQYTLNEIKKLKKDHFSTYDPIRYHLLFSESYYELYKKLI
ncbi:nicotinate phosphoribosyltransferase, putative [Plasmodium chabaudi chabaudi]|uniref:nicotinate phosphoribosyltransferase n=1 Tax=Plasmodium chabaudi chabaudi TaxID=31271 RepID=A0A1D3RYM2_PLACU|nr:nicotinate phosphoribosyltransferase, putative [Plasmodium chabaudi chabaudi]